MSTVSLKSISTNSQSTQTDFYIGALIDSESGFLIPKLITSVEDLDAFYGKFDYNGMYRSFIRNNVPILVLPIITPISEYNRCSIRLSNGKFQVTHPKYKKDYEYREFSVLHFKNFTQEDFNENNEVEIEHSLEFYPEVVVEVDNELVDCFVTYSPGKIKVKFPEAVSGSISFEEFPLIDKVPEYVIIKKHNAIGSDFRNGVYTFKSTEKIIPEVVITDSQGVACDYYVKIIEGPFISEIRIEISNYDEDEEYQMDLRIIPEYLTVVKNLDSSREIVHNTGHYPNIKVTEDLVLASAGVKFINENKVSILVSDLEKILVKYNYYNVETLFNYKLLLKNEIVFNTILDFSGVSDEQLNLDGENLYAGYLILELNKRRHLIKTQGILPSTVTNTYYDTDKNNYITGVTRYDWFSELKEYGKRVLGNENSTDLEERIQRFIERMYDKFAESKKIVDDNNYLSSNEKIAEIQSIYNEWKKSVIFNSYIEDWWLCTNTEAVAIIKQLFEDFVYDYQSDLLDELTEAIKELGLPNDKILFLHSVPAVNMQFYNFEGVQLYQDFNLTQDVLCELTEQDKICEFYSKVKGSAGRNISITIQPIPGYKYVYEILVQAGSKSESYLVYTHRESYLDQLGLGVEDLLDEDDSGNEELELLKLEFRQELEQIRIDLSKEFEQAIEILEVRRDDLKFKQNGLDPGQDEFKQLESKIKLIDDELDKKGLEFSKVIDLRKLELLNLLDKEIPLPDGTIPFYEIGVQSELVISRLFDYELLSGKFIDQYEFDLYKSSGEEFDAERLRSFKDLKLPIGTWNLDRVMSEDLQYEDVENSLDIYQESEWHPDFFCVCNLNYGDNNNRFLNKLLYFSKAIYTQSLVRLDYKHLNPLFTLPNSDNRIAYFYDDILVGRVRYCSFYPYVLNMINDNYLGIINFKLIFDGDTIRAKNGILLNGMSGIISKVELPRLKVRLFSGEVIDGEVVNNKLIRFGTHERYTINSITDYLIKHNINFLLYNNLYYYYPTIRESARQPDIFIIRFLCSKIVRWFLDRKHDFINIDRGSINKVVHIEIGKLLNLLPLIISIVFDYTIQDNRLNFNLRTTVRNLVNKEYNINLTLKI